MRNGFVSFDDGTYVTANTHVQGGLTWEGLEWAFQTSTASNWHPLTWLSHMLDWQLYGAQAWGHHLTSLLLHTLNTILLYLVLQALTGNRWRSWFVAALFGLHPLRVESVAWVAERKDVLSGFFFMLTLYAWARYVQSPKSKVQSPMTEVQSSWVWYSLALLFYAVGLMSKQMLVTVPFLLLLLDVWPLARWQLLVPAAGTGPAWGESAEENTVRDHSRNPPIKNIRFILFEKVPFFVLALVFSLVVYLVQHRAGATGMIGELPIGARLENAMVSYARYLFKFCWPLDLAVFYPHPGYWPATTVIGAAVFVVAITAGVWTARRSRPYLLVGWLWYLVTLLPVIGLVQVGRQSMADRYTYLPMIGISIAVVWGISAVGARDVPARSNQEAATDEGIFARLRPRRKRRGPGRPALRFSSDRLGFRWVAVAAGASAVVALTALTFRQVQYWKDSETLFRHAIDAVPDNYLAHGNLAVYLQQQHKYQEAFLEVQEALRLKPDDVNTRNSLGSVLMNLDRVDEAIGCFMEAIRRWSDFAEAHSNLSFAYQKQGRLAEALPESQAALKLNPSDFRLHVNLAGLLLKLGRAPEAIPYLQQAVQLEPADAATRKDLAALLFNAGRFEEAAAQFEAVGRADPTDAEAQANLGFCLARLGRTDEAGSHLAQALKLRPDYPEAQQELKKLREAVKP